MIQLHNHHPTENIAAWLLSMVPWFVRLYLHTMTVSVTGSSHTKNSMTKCKLYILCVKYGDVYNTQGHCKLGFSL